jgi:ribonuclease HI
VTDSDTGQSEIVVYTDGACDPNPGPGGWAAILRYGHHEKVISGGEPDTTNNRMELRAALEALRALKRPCQLTLYTDSEYLRRGITEWLPDWQARGWRTSQRKPVQNQDLWQALTTEMARHTVDWQWVRGHTGDPLNERVDGLARAAIPRPTRSVTQPEPRRPGDPEPVQVFTRASCLGTSGPGGWAVVFRRGDALTSLSGSSGRASANEMELQAALEGLKGLEEGTPVDLYTVSQYLQQGITRWVKSWETRGWQTKGGAAVRHKAVWMALQEVAQRHQIRWHLLPGDERPTESEQAAVLAAQAARILQEISEGAKD